jgi:uncharacterized FlaG/YvyC family protein
MRVLNEERIMDIGAVTRAPATASQVTTVREPAQSSIPPVSTVLAANKVVTNVGAAQNVRGESVQAGDIVQVSDAARAQEARLQALQKTIETRLDIDPTTREVVFRSYNQQTGRTIVQVPDEVSLRLRQFAALVREKEAAAKVDHQQFSSVA